MTGFLNRVKVTTATTGQGTSIVLGAAVNDSFFAPADVGAVNAQTYSYIIIQGLDFEIQVGQVYTSAGTSIARGTPVKSKIGGVVGTTKIDLDGTALVGFIASAEDVIALIVAAASDTVAGKVELATVAEAEAQTDTSRAVTPAGLANFALLSEVTKTQVGLSSVTNDAQLKIASNLSDCQSTATAFGNIKQAASETATGVVELATVAEAEAQTDTSRAVTPAGLANFALLSEVTKTQVGLSAVTNDAQLKIASNLSDVNNAATAFGNIKQAASDTATGVVELATQAEAEAQTDTARACTPNSLANFALVSELPAAASTTEVQTGTDTAKKVTPDALAALWEKGSNIASTSPLVIGEGGYFHITGTNSISDIDWTTAKDGRWAWVVFDGILTLTHNGTTLNLPGGANITTAAGDRALFIQDNADNVYCLAYIRATGKALIANTATDVGLGSVTNDAQLKIASNLSDCQSTATAFGNIKQAASETATGVVELATVAEAEAQTDTSRAVTPAGLANFALLSEVTKTQVGLVNVTNDAQLKIASNLSDLNNAATAFGNIKQAASETATGVVELATVAEAEAQTDTSRAVTPAGLANFAMTSEVTGAVSAASDTAAGKVELATVAEAEAQTDTARAVTPAGLANYALLSEALKPNVADQTISGGARITVNDLGNLSGQTITPDPGDRPHQKITNNGAGTILPGSNYGDYILDVINTTGAGAITLTGWVTKGDSFDTTTTSKFRCHCSVTADMALMSRVKVA